MVSSRDKFTHVGKLKCALATADPRYCLREHKFRETKLYWVSVAGTKYLKRNGQTTDWRWQYTLDITTIRKLDENESTEVSVR